MSEVGKMAAWALRQHLVPTEENRHRRSRKVQYYVGGWDAICRTLPEFELAPFGDAPAATPNPLLRTVRRKSLDGEAPLPVGAVSPGYALVQHREVATLCRQGLLDTVADEADLQYEVGVSEFGEWMNLRIFLPREYAFLDPHGGVNVLRLECSNAVDGSSPLDVWFGWFRRVCSNGMVIERSKLRITERHDYRLQIAGIPRRIAATLDVATADRQRIDRWIDAPINMDEVATWVDHAVANRWGKTAAARVFHICRSGHDVDLVAFEAGAATEKPVRTRHDVPGSPGPARSRFDVAQALSYVATHRNDVDDRLSRQSDIAALMRVLPRQSR